MKKLKVECVICKKSFMKYKDDYETIMCRKCYEFIMNTYKPTGILKELFDELPCNDSCSTWDEVAHTRWNVYNIIKKRKVK